MIPNRRILVLLAIFALVAEPKAERTDCYGDPLPEGAMARIGTVRGRLPGLATACVFSRDGKTLVAAGGDAAIHLFDAATLRPLRQLQQHKKTVTCLAFAPDGKTLVSGSEDGTLCFWDWPDGKMRRQFAAHQKGVRVLAFAGTGKFLASGGEDNRVRLWDAATRREMRQYKGHNDIVTALAVSPDGRFVASSDKSFSGKVQLWDAVSGRLLHESKAGVLRVQSLAFSPDSKLVALPVDFLRIALWDVESGKILRRFSGDLSGSLSSVAFSPDGRTVATAAANCCLVLWDAVTSKILHQLPGKNYFRHPGGITCLTFSSDGRRLAFGDDHRLRVWDIGTWREVCPVEGHANCIDRVLFSCDNKTLVTMADEPADALQEWDAATGKKLRTLWHKYLIGKDGFHLSPDHAVLTVAETAEKNLLLRSWNTTTGKEIRRLKLPFDYQGGYNPNFIVLSPDGKIITSESRENRGVLLRDTTTGKVLGKVSGYFDPLFPFSPDSNTLAYVGDRDAEERKQIDLYNVPTGQVLWNLPLGGEEYYPRSLAFSRDSRLVAVASSNSNDSTSNRLDLWETTTGRKRTALSALRASPLVPTFSLDGALLAFGDAEGVLHLWSVATGKEIRQLPGHRGGIAALAFAHDGKRLASGSWDTTAIIWDIREAAEAAWPHPADVPQERLEKLWADLAGEDGDRVHRAIWNLVAARQLVPWLRDHLKPVPPPDARRIAQLLTDLDSDTFAVREKATRELAEMGEAAEPGLRKVLAEKPSLEMRRRIEPLVKDLERWPASSPTALRNWRALEVLEHLGTPEAQKLLQELANGLAEARLTREAKAALQRLAARGDTRP